MKFSTATDAVPDSPFDNDGMTLRDYFAAAAIARMLPLDYTHTENVLGPEAWEAKYVSNIAKTAYAIADAMLRERDK